jgi:hypothetical protein
MWKFSKHENTYAKPRQNQQKQNAHKQKFESVLTMALAARFLGTLSPINSEFSSSAYIK